MQNPTPTYKKMITSSAMFSHRLGEAVHDGL